MYDNQLEKLEEKLDDLRFDRETCVIQKESGFDVEKKLAITDNLIKELERQIVCRRGENAGTTSGEIQQVSKAKFIKNKESQKRIEIACRRGGNAGTASEERTNL